MLSCRKQERILRFFEVCVFTCIKPLVSSKIFNEVTVKMTEPADVFWRKLLKSVICLEASLERSLITHGLPVLVHPSPFTLFPSLTATAILLASSVYIDEQLINACDYWRLRCSHWSYCEAKSFSGISKYTSVLISVLISCCSSLLLSTYECCARKKHFYATVSSSAGCCSAVWPFLSEEVSHQVLMSPAWRDCLTVEWVQGLHALSWSSSVLNSENLSRWGKGKFL